MHTRTSARTHARTHTHELTRAGRNSQTKAVCARACACARVRACVHRRGFNQVFGAAHAQAETLGKRRYSANKTRNTLAANDLTTYLLLHLHVIPPGIQM